MNLTGEHPFRFWVRPDPGMQTAAVRFELKSGRGVLSLRVPDREDPAPTSHYEELDIPVGAIKGGRFLHALPTGNRRSYGLSGLTKETLAQLQPGRWVELDAVTDKGFRYLSVPPGSAQPAKPAAVSVASEVPAMPRGAVPARQTPMNPSLAQEALGRLSHQDALAYLHQEMAKVETLHQHAAELERQLKASQAREKDLLTVLQRWQTH